MMTEHKNPAIHCRLCGCHVQEAAQRGAWLERVNPKGENFIGECRPGCDCNNGNQDDALLGAMESQDDD